MAETDSSVSLLFCFSTGEQPRNQGGLTSAFRVNISWLLKGSCGSTRGSVPNPWIHRAPLGFSSCLQFSLRTSSPSLGYSNSTSSELDIIFTLLFPVWNAFLLKIHRVDSVSKTDQGLSQMWIACLLEKMGEAIGGNKISHKDMSSKIKRENKEPVPILWLPWRQLTSEVFTKITPGWPCSQN